MAGIGAIMGIASSAVGMMGSIAQAKAMNEQAKAESMQMGMMAAEEKAVASRDAQAKDKEGRLLLSRGQAVAAASGGGATDPTVLELAGDIGRETSVQKRELMRQGQEKARNLEYKATVGRWAAKQQGKMTILGGIGNMIGGIGEGLGGLASAFDKYGGGGPGTPYTGQRATTIPPWYYG
jgi:hypothetical protein